MRPWLHGWAAPFVGGLVLVFPSAGQDVTRVDPVIEIQQKLPAEIEPDEPIPIEVRIRNTGKIAAEAVSVTDTPKAGVELVSAEPFPVRTNGALAWSLGKIGPGEERVIKVRLKRGTGTGDPRFLHSVDVTYQAKGQNTAEAKVRQPALTLDVAGAGPATVGSPVTLRLTVNNPGPGPVRDVTVECRLPDGLTHASGNELEKAVGTLEPGTSRTVALTLTPTRAGGVAARIKVHAKGMTAMEETAKLDVTPPPLTLTAVPAAMVEANKPALFEVVVASEAAEARPGVEVWVTLPKEMTFVRATDRGSYDAGTRTVRWDLGAIQAGEKRGVVWNGIVKGAGKWTCPATLIVDGKAQGEVPVTVRAVAAGER